MENIRKLLDKKKIKFNWNKEPIPMDLFISFLTIETKISTEHLGYWNGWTRRVNEEYKLIISGGITGGVNYLDSIQYGTKLDNPYNNYVNPFYLFDILTDEGKRFFLEYYKKDIDSIIEKQKQSVSNTEQRLVDEKLKLFQFQYELENILK